MASIYESEVEQRIENFTTVSCDRLPLPWHTRKPMHCFMSKVDQ